jgi:hypothetical protein
VPQEAKRDKDGIIVAAVSLLVDPSTVPPAPAVPEPSSGFLFGLGAVAMTVYGWCRGRRRVEHEFADVPAPQIGAPAVDDRGHGR